MQHESGVVGLAKARSRRHRIDLPDDIEQAGAGGAGRDFEHRDAASLGDRNDRRVASGWNDDGPRGKV